jgi:hypothetical protein
MQAASILAVAAFLAGCSASVPPPGQPGPSHAPPARSGLDVPSAVVSGAADSVSPRPGSPGALYRFRFRQIDPASDRFTFLDRDLSFYFRPTPAALFFQVENRQGRPVWIDWERSSFGDPLGSSGKIAHATTRWGDRFRSQSPTQIAGLQRYTDYFFPVDYLVDPGSSDAQLHRPLLPEDSSAPQFEDREFGVSLVFLIEDQPRVYNFRFRVASVIPK